MVAKRIQGSVTPGSGNQWFAKGDIDSKDYLIEAKRTDDISIKLASRVWEKIRHEALAKSKIPLMAMQMRGWLTDRHDLIVMDMSDFLELDRKSRIP